MNRIDSNFKLKCFSLIIVFTIVAQSIAPVFACGPFTVDPLFSFTRHSDYPILKFTDGNVGIVPETFGRMSLYVFYRQLNNQILTPSEQKQISEAIKVRIGGHWSENNKSQSAPNSSEIENKKDFVKFWIETRSKVLSEDVKISTDKLKEDNYQYVYNCLPDSFHTAAQALQARIAKYGNGSEVKEWIKGQDAVFSNCSDEGKVPKTLTSQFPEWLRQDRNYQIAAALFYQDKFTESRAAFRQIAADNNSPWSKTAKFVVARTYIREASYIDEESPDYAPVPDSTSNISSNTNMVSNSNIIYNKPDPVVIKSIEVKKGEISELQQKAIAQLRDILADASMNEFHDSAHRLLDLLEYRANPDQRRLELAKILTQQKENNNIYNDLTDYIWLLDRVETSAKEIGYETDKKEAEKAGKENGSVYDYSLKLRDVPENERTADLTDWLFSYQARDSYAHSLEKWQTSKSPVWLVAALTKAEANSPNVSELIAEADKIFSTSPAFATARFHQIRVLLESGKRTEAKQKIAEVFKGNLSKFNISTQNKFYSQRMIAAENLNEFLTYAQRRPATFVWSDDANEEGTDLKSPAIFDETDLSDKKLRAWADRTMFDEDAAAFFNEKMPLSVLREAALSPQLPDHLKKFVVTAVWTRAFILKNQVIEREFAPLVLKYAPEYQPLFSKYAASTSANREAAALITVLRYPVMQPFVPVGYGRDISEPTALDSNRGNWWCVKSLDEDYSIYYDRFEFNHPNVYPNFLTAEQVKAAEAETGKLSQSNNSATYLTRRAIEFANNNPKNPQTPEILHLAIRATRYGCTDAETVNVSKQAFQILHSHYPKSVWTKQTPYWFG